MSVAGADQLQADDASHDRDQLEPRSTRPRRPSRPQGCSSTDAGPDGVADPSGRLRSAVARRVKLPAAHTTKRTLGTGRVKPLLAFSDRAKPVSKRPARITSAQAMVTLLSWHAVYQPRWHGRTRFRSGRQGCQAIKLHNSTHAPSLRRARRHGDAFASRVRAW